MLPRRKHRDRVHLFDDARNPQVGEPGGGEFFADALVWHGAALLVKSGRAFGKGDLRVGGELWERGLKEMDGAVALVPDSPAILIDSATAANPASPGYGVIMQGYTEASNVDPVSEITNLIVAQRAYEMNSKVVTTADQMLSTATNTKS